MAHVEIEYNAAVMKSLAAAMSDLETKYKFTMSPHPDKGDTIRVVFSRPTFQSPESPVFVRLDLTIKEVEGSTITFVGHVESLQWPIIITVRENQIECFPERYIDKIWMQKMSVKKMPLWV